MTRLTGNKKLSEGRIRKFLTDHRNGTVPPHAKLADGDGMYLTVTAGGTPVWRVKYRFNGTESTYTIGPYGPAPAVTLEAARAEREAVRARLREGNDPVKVRTVERAGAAAASEDTFHALAQRWLAKRKRWSEIHRRKSLQALERDVFPYIGKLPVRDITAAMIAKMMERVASRGVHDTATKILQHVTRIFDLARTEGLRDNPAAAVREALPDRERDKQKRPAFLKWDQLGGVMRAAETARLSPAVRLAHRLCAFSTARISNIVQAEWPELHLDEQPAVWVIPRKKMKVSRDRAFDHKIVLGATIAEELRQWRELIGSKGWVFPSPTDPKKHITRESLEKVYRVTLALEDKHTPHGWRAAFTTLARDEGGFDRDVVELALDHIHDTDVVRAYDRGERLQQRIKLMTWWGDQLAQAQRGAEVIPMRKGA